MGRATLPTFFSDKPDVWASLEQSGRLGTSGHFPEPVRFTRTDRSDTGTGLGKVLDPRPCSFLFVARHLVNAGPNKL